MRSKLNAAKHGLSLPVDERLFADEIEAIAELIQSECGNRLQAHELAKRITDFERNEAFLSDYDLGQLSEDIKAWGKDSHRIALVQLTQRHRNKQAVSTTFTVPAIPKTSKLTGKQRSEEIKFLEGFLRLQDKVLMGKIKAGKDSHASAQRYQKRAINQLVKGIRTVAKGEGFDFYKTKPF